jgi:hypothetical protein
MILIKGEEADVTQAWSIHGRDYHAFSRRRLDRSS